MTTVVRRRKTAAPAVALDRPAAEPPRKAADTYARNAEGRRIDFLEAMAWLVIRLESFDAEAKAFAEEIRTNRDDHWFAHPWAKADDPDRFEEHVLAMARALTAPVAKNAVPSYPVRKSP
jgi:hypothetical protein